jgi:hypothetical protein
VRERPQITSRRNKPMGTSTSVPGSPKWEKVKGASSRVAGKNSVDSEKVSDIVADFVDKLRDGKDEGIGTLPPRCGDDLKKVSENLKELLKEYPRSPTPLPPAFPQPATQGPSAGGGGGGGSGGGRTPGRARTGRSGGGGGVTRSVRAITSRGLRPTAARVATFLSNVAEFGLAVALKDVGIDLKTASTDQVAISLADVLCGPNSLLVDVEIRAATSALVEELYPGLDSPEELEASLDNAAVNLGEVLGRLFENYIMERFKTTLSEHLSKYSYSAADKLAKEARVLVATEMKIVEAERVDFSKVDWTGTEGSGILDAILEKTIAIYLS